MADFFSTQLAVQNTTPRSDLRGREAGGHVRAFAFNWTGDAAQNDLVYLCELPEGARVVGGAVERTALGASVTGNLRTETTDLAFNTGGAVDYSAAGTYTIQNAASGVGYIAGKAATRQGKERVYLVLAGANPASGTIRGHILATVG